ncbi:hypothetical protein [Pseudomonas japonica]|uniref:Uncharacterized protein n=1 Tax=Pseudomonas japonica TaxID=256466 RepID=A0A239J9E6_9PSED|nr:hypothetical protein [Pseudomonas japonica]SNT02636.1 hypothetical protein SAMN05444352_12187 [Pseudomonas japonica]
MDITLTSCKTVGLAILLYISASAYADEAPLPASCFNEEDYPNYLGTFDQYQKERSSQNYVALKIQLRNQKKIKLEVHQSQPSSGATITLDASGTTVPSGKPTFVWGSSADATAGSAIKTYPGRTSDTYFKVGLRVLDQVCKIEESTQITITSK